MSRTVYCRRCYTAGHNKRSCPVITDQLKSEFFHYNERAKDYREMGSHYVGSAERAQKTAEHYRSKYIGRSGKDPETGQKVTKKAAKAARMKDRTCTYCQNMGHTRRTCDVLNQDMEVMKTATKFMRRDYTDRLRMHKVNKGTLVVMEISTYVGDEWTRIKVPYMLTAFQWDRTAWTLQIPTERIIHFKALTDRIPERDRYRELSLLQLEDAVSRGQVTLSSHGIEPPAVWLDGKTTDPIKTFFPLKTHRNYDFQWRQYQDDHNPLYRARIALGLSMEKSA